MFFHPLSYAHIPTIFSHLSAQGKMYLITEQPTSVMKALDYSLTNPLKEQTNDLQEHTDECEAKDLPKNVEVQRTVNDFDAETYLQHLSEMFNGKKQYMMEMIEILLHQIPGTTQKMEEAILVENWEEVFFQSHRIKSTFRIAGLKKLVNVCLAIEGRTRIIAPEELHLVPDFFLQFKEYSAAEIPNLEAALKYLQGEQSRSEANEGIIKEVKAEEDTGFEVLEMEDEKEEETENLQEIRTKGSVGLDTEVEGVEMAAKEDEVEDDSDFMILL